MLSDVEHEVDHKHMVEIIDQQIPINLRALWVRLQNGIGLNKAEREKLYPAIHDILEKEGIHGTQAW